MKYEYKAPAISYETLETADVLVTSETTPVQPILNKKAKKENRYGDFMSFVLDGKWFDD